MPRSSTKKSKRSRKRPPAVAGTPELIAGAISSLRTDLGFKTQRAFAAALGVKDPSVVSGWETGKQAVPPNWLNRLAALSARKDRPIQARQFLEWAEFDREALARLGRSYGTKGIQLREYKTAVLFTPTGEPDLQFGRHLVPRPHAAFAIRAADDSMAPAFWQGDIVVVDESPLSLSEFGAALDRSLIVAAYVEGAVVLRYARLQPGVGLQPGKMWFESESFYLMVADLHHLELEEVAELAADVGAPPLFVRPDAVALPGARAPKDARATILGRVIVSLSAEVNRAGASARQIQRLKSGAHNSRGQEQE